MFDRSTLSIRSLAPFLVLAALLCGTLPAMGSPPVAETAGSDFGEWSAAWWQWALSFPAADSPLLAQGATDCTAGQSGAVWFLAGAPAGSTAVRSCTVPQGKMLFFPVASRIGINAFGEEVTVAEKRRLLNGALSGKDAGLSGDRGATSDRACGIEATIDGLPVTYFVAVARVQSVFPITVHRDAPAGFPGGTSDPQAVSDGVWVMLPPLSPGQHTLRLSGAGCPLDSPGDRSFGPLDVTYQLTVTGLAPRHGGGHGGHGGHGGGGHGGGHGGPPQDEVEIVQSLYDAFAVGDLDTINAIIHPDVVWIESEGIPYGGTFIGRDAVFAGVFGKIAAEWDDFTANIEEIFKAEGNRVIVLGADSGTFKATGKSMTAPAASIWTLDNQGQVIRFVQYIDTQAVVSATIP